MTEEMWALVRELYQGIKNRNLELIRRLLSETPELFAYGDSISETWMHDAARLGHIDVIELLLELGVSPNPLREQTLSPLDYAIGEGHLAATRYLLEHGSNPNDPQQLPFCAITAKSNGPWSFGSWGTEKFSGSLTVCIIVIIASPAFST